MLRRYYKTLRQRRRIQRLQTPTDRFNSTIIEQDKSVSCSLGGETLILRSLETTAPVHANYDFVAFALAALSMSKNIEIDVEFQVSESAAAQIQNITNAYRLWSIIGLAPLRLNFGNIVPDLSLSERTSQPNGGLICLSGGLDSMSAAIEAKASGGTTHALFVAGADFVDGEQSGFVERNERVSAIAGALELDLLRVETNIRQVGLNWALLHSFNLAFCLHYFARSHTFGSFAQDNNAEQDGFRMPWGNLNVLPSLFSTDNFEIKTYGTKLDRVGKLRSVLEYDENLLKTLSVCNADKTIGGNCGTCPKCIQTRSALMAVGYPDKDLFNALPDIATSVRAFDVPTKSIALRGRMVRTSELVNGLPDGEIRDAFVEFEQKMRRNLQDLMPEGL